MKKSLFRYGITNEIYLFVRPKFNMNRKNLGVEKSLLSFSRDIKDIFYTKTLKKCH